MTSAASLDFRFLKSRVSIERVLAARGLLAPMRRNGDNLVGPCPIHQGDSTTAFVVSTAKDLWHCFTGCRAGGDVVDLVRRLDSSDYRSTALYLAALAGSAHLATRAVSTPRPFRPFTARLNLDPDVGFLAAKGIHPATAGVFDAGAYPGSGFLRGCIAVRLHDQQGQPLGYAGRVLDPDRARTGKWRLPARLPKQELLFNFHRVSQRFEHGLVLVEDPWSVMRLAQIGVPAVALLGTTLSNQQAELLAPATHVLIMLDGDQAGRSASRELRSRLSRAQTAVADLPDGHDPDQLSDHDLRACCYLFLPDLVHHAA